MTHEEKLAYIRFEMTQHAPTSDLWRRLRCVLLGLEWSQDDKMYPDWIKEIAVGPSGYETT